MNIIIAMIPGRIGSTRLKSKNFALINDEPLMGHVTRAAVNAGVFDKIYINGDDQRFKSLADRYQVDFHLRPRELGGSDVRSDDVVYEFMKAHPASITVWLNPICPLQPSSEIRDVMKFFINENLDSLVTSIEDQVHVNFNHLPLNYSTEGKFEQTQNLRPISRFTYSIMAWRNQTYLDVYKKNGSGFFCGKFATYNVSKLSSFMVKTEEDLLLIDAIARGYKGKLAYDPVFFSGAEGV